MKLLLSLPTSELAQQYYGSDAPTYNKVGDAGVDLPFLQSFQPYDCQIDETLPLQDFGTVFAMYDLGEPFGDNVETLFDFMLEHEEGARDTDIENLTALLEPKGFGDEPKPVAFYITPRSSIGKYPYRQSNSIGIIDKNYKGIKLSNETEDLFVIEEDTLKVSLDYHPLLGRRGNNKVKAGDRLFQIVAPSLDDILHVRLDYTKENCKFWMESVCNESRGSFGSTGV